MNFDDEDDVGRDRPVVKKIDIYGGQMAVVMWGSNFQDLSIDSDLEDYKVFLGADGRLVDEAERKRRTDKRDALKREAVSDMQELLDAYLAMAEARLRLLNKELNDI